MANLVKFVYVAVVVLCFTGAVLCESDSNVQESRTFGHHFLKRISFAIIPAGAASPINRLSLRKFFQAFVVGMITTLLAALTVVSVNGLGVGVVLLILTIGQMIARGLPNALPLTAAAYAPAPAPYPVYYKDW